MTNPKQLGFFDSIHPVRALIEIKENHELLRLAKVIPWPEQIEIAMNCRAAKVKALVGPEPHYRELLGAVADVRSKYHVSPSRRSYQALWSGKVSLQFDGLQLVARPHHNIRVRSNAGSRGNGAIEQDIFKRSTKSWNFRCNNIDVGHDRAGSDDSVSERSRFNEKVYRPCFQINFKSSRNCIKYKDKSERDFEKSKIIGSRVTLVCKDQGAEAESWQEAVSYDSRTSRFIKKLFEPINKHQEQIRNRASAAIGFNESFVSTDFTFFNDRFCSTEKDYSFTNVRAVRNRSWQSRKVRRIWNQMGDQSNRWICTGFCDAKYDQCFRQKVLYRRHSKTHRAFWYGTREVWLRPRRTQSCKYKEGESVGCKTCWYRTTWPSRMERIDEDVGRNQMRTCASRRFNRKFEIKKVRLQQTQCQINQGNDYVGTPLVLGVQSVQGFAATESVGSLSNLVTNQVVISNKRYKLIHRKTKYHS